MRPLHLTLLALALTVSACKSGGGTDTPGSVSTRPATRDPDRITGDQIQEGLANGLGNAYDLVARLHPNWLRSQGRQSVQVWMDNQRMGGVSSLRNMSLSGLASIRYLRPSEAQARYGLDNQGGAIVLSIR